MEKLVIGLIGKSGSGKATCAALILDQIKASGLTAVRLGFSDLLRETLSEYGVESSRGNLQLLAICLNQMRKGALSFKMGDAITKAAADVVLIDGLRWEHDFELLKQYPRYALLFVDASPEVRFERLRKRAQKPGEMNMSWETFAAAEQVATETQITDLAKQADQVIDNNGDLEDLKTQVEKWWSAFRA